MISSLKWHRLRLNGYAKVILLIVMLTFLVFIERYEPLFTITFTAYVFLLLFWLIRQYIDLVRLRQETKKTELLHLQSQVNPHFFFNTLNNLYGLIGKDQEKARQMVLQLSDMMRYSIYDGQKEWVGLAEEVSYLQQYIALQQSRYHRVVRIDFQTDIADTTLEVKPLLFIILVENAFKHGVENRREEAGVTIRLSADAKRITFTTQNKIDPDSQQGGLGLPNLRRRLALSYPGRHTLNCSTTDDTYEAKLTLIP